MRRKCIFFMYMAVVLILSTTFAWAGNGDFQTEKPIDEIELPYTYPTLVKSIFSITSGTAKCGVVDYLSDSESGDIDDNKYD